MKADWCGTLTEQKRHRMGWLNATQRKNKGVSASCGDCASFDESSGAHCTQGEFTTRAGSYCKAHTKDQS